MIKWDRPCYKCLSHFCDLSCKEPKHLQASQSKEPEQEPVAWADHGVVNWIADKQFKHASLLYTTPPQRPWVGLTDDEIAELHHEIKVRLMGTYKTEDIYRAIEAKLKEKNGA